MRVRVCLCVSVFVYVEVVCLHSHTYTYIHKHYANFHAARDIAYFKAFCLKHFIAINAAATLAPGGAFS